MTDLKRRLWEALTRGPSALERKLLSLLAARYALRAPCTDAPRYASSEDIEAPNGVLNRSGMIALAFRFLYGNIMTGDYLEFGCWTGRTFRMAWEHHKRHFEGKTHFWLFDSFQGLPELAPIDRHPKWRPGAYRAPVDELVSVADRAGIPRSAYTLVPGYYEETLTAERAHDLASRGVRAGIVYVDCDLYESARQVLDFTYPLLQPGTVLCFDDFFCFNGSPERGEQRAVREFLQKHPDVEFVEYLNFGWHGKSFLVHRGDGP